MYAHTYMRIAPYVSAEQEAIATTFHCMEMFTLAADDIFRGWALGMWFKN